MPNYPGGKKTPTTISDKKITKSKSCNSANRGMAFEADINVSNAYYLDQNRAIITKRPTPINVVKVDYSKGARIIDAYFEKQSTTDYNGVYRGRYIDFEAKSCQNKTSFPLSNITYHQINHLKHVIKHGGIAFFLIYLCSTDEVYLIDAKYIIDAFENGDRKSIPFNDLKEKGHLVNQGYLPRISYLDVVDKVYFNEEKI